MDTNETNNNYYVEPEPEHRSGSGKFWLIGGALALALGANGYLIVRSNHLSDELAAIRDGNTAQFAKMNQSAAASDEDYRDRFDKLSQSINDVHSSAASAHTALKRFQADEKKANDDFSQKLDAQKTDFGGQLSTLSSDTSSKFSQVTTDVGGVKTDVDGLKTQVADDRTQLEQHTADLKRVVGDMGVMSGLIATNGKDLDALRQLGERNYYEFSVAKNQKQVRVGNVTLALKKVDQKHNRYTIDVMADDKLVEKKDRTTNEPIQIYVSGARQPDEIVVNTVQKDTITGYLATPKVTVSRR
jgi:septal ring factor EnvC (AmiA/AmiB activator)